MHSPGGQVRKNIGNSVRIVREKATNIVLIIAIREPQRNKVVALRKYCLRYLRGPLANNHEGLRPYLVIRCEQHLHSDFLFPPVVNMPLHNKQILKMVDPQGFEPWSENLQLLSFNYMLTLVLLKSGK